MVKLGNMQNCALKSDTHYTVVTILNYELYQGSGKAKGTTQGTGKGQARDTNKNDKNVKNKEYVEDSDELRLASFLLEGILKNKPDFKRLNLQTWAKDIDLMIRRDGRNPDRIREVIHWTQNDSFWRKNILSTGSLRKSFDRLEMAMGKISTQDSDPYPDLTNRTKGGKR
jgi:hypothetical protein